MDLDFQAEARPVDSDEGDVDWDIGPRSMHRPTRVGPLLDAGGVVLGVAAGLDGAKTAQQRDFSALAAAWNSTQHQLGNHVLPAGVVKLALHPRTTSLFSMAKLAFTSKMQPR